MFERGKKSSDETDRGTGGDAAPATGKTANRRSGSREAAVIGASIQIDGDVRGEEDLIIQGEVSGKINLLNNSLTVGRDGKVKADVRAQAVFVDGHVDGDLIGSERVCIRSTAQVRGNITSPRVSLEDGARFKGSIEMDPEAVESLLGKKPASGRSAGHVTKPTVAKSASSNDAGKSRDLLTEAKTSAAS